MPDSSCSGSFLLQLADGRQLSVPKGYFPRLANTSNEALLNYEFSGDGLGIHWDELDEDIYVPNLLLGIGSTLKTPVSA